jgi:hypothetical protein
LMLGRMMSPSQIKWSQVEYRGRFTSSLHPVLRDLLLLTPIFRRVHISASTYERVRDLYEVEDGNGDVRNEYIKDSGIKTYLIIGKHKSKAKVSLVRATRVSFSDPCTMIG